MSYVSQQEVHSFTPSQPTPSLFCTAFTDLSNLIMSKHAEVMVSSLQLMLLRKKKIIAKLNTLFYFDF